MSADEIERLARDFVCPKCHGQGAQAHEVALGRAVAGVIPVASGRFLAVSCVLCGYTEFYQLARVVRADVDAPAHAPRVQWTEQTE